MQRPPYVDWATWERIEQMAEVACKHLEEAARWNKMANTTLDATYELHLSQKAKRAARQSTL